MRTKPAPEKQDNNKSRIAIEVERRVVRVTVKPVEDDDDGRAGRATRGCDVKRTRSLAEEVS